MEKLNISFSSKTVEISEYKNYIELVNRVCYYGEPNANGTRLPYDESTLSKAKTLEGMPVYAKYTVDAEGKPTFKGHEAYIDESGEVAFNTIPIGVHTEIYLKDDTVELADKRVKTLPCLFAKQKVWKRNKNAVSAVKRLYEENNLHNSWEIASFEYAYKNGIKDLLDYVFEGNTYLGTEKPAYGDSAKVISLSGKNSEMLIAEALSKDIAEHGEFIGSEETDMLEEENVEEVQTETPVENTENKPDDVAAQEDTIAEETNPEKVKEDTVASLSDFDIRHMLLKAVEEALDTWVDLFMVFPEEKELWVKPYSSKDTEFIKYTYTVTGDSVSLSDPAPVTLTVTPRQINATLEEKNNALIESQKQIDALTNENTILSTFKVAYEKAEQEKAEAEKATKVQELHNYAEKSGCFTKDELDSGDVFNLISELKTVEVKAIIADRIIAKIAANKQPETSSVHTKPKEKTDINFNESQTDKPLSKEEGSATVRSWIRKK